MAIREGRRSGKSFAMALKLLYYAYNLKLDRGEIARQCCVYGTGYNDSNPLSSSTNKLI